MMYVGYRIGFVETCNPFSMLVCAFCHCWIVARWWKSCRPPPPKRFSDTPNPKATHCLLFAVCFVLINNYVRALTTSTPLTVNLAIISSIRQGSLVLEIFSMVISLMLPIHCEDVHLAPHHGSHIHVIHHAEHDSWCTQIKKCAFVVFIFSF